MSRHRRLKLKHRPRPKIYGIIVGSCKGPIEPVFIHTEAEFFAHFGHPQEDHFDSEALAAWWNKEDPAECSESEDELPEVFVTPDVHFTMLHPTQLHELKEPQGDICQNTNLRMGTLT